MSLLGGLEIAKLAKEGKDIIISDFDESRVGPNSYNLRLHNELLVYEGPILDMKKDNPTSKLIIPEEGLVLQPGVLYLGRTMEFTETHKYAPMLEGRSSIGRLGIEVHISAGFGDVGFDNAWTLEITVVHPVRVYAGVEICQISYQPIVGEYIEYNSDKYQGKKGLQSSQLYKDFIK